MYVVRRLAFVAFCALLPFVITTEASAVPLPVQIVNVTLRSMSITLRPFSGSACPAVTVPTVSADLVVGGDSVLFSLQTVTCGNARIGEWLAASAYVDPNTGRQKVMAFGVMNLQKKIDGVWREQKAIEIGRIVDVPADLRSSWSISSGNAAGTFNYRIVTFEN